MMRYTATELEAMETLSSAQADDLKVDTGTERVWLSRVGVADGAPYGNQVFHESLIDGKWVTTDEYRG